MITCLNGADHMPNHALITWLSCTDELPQEAIIKELSRHESCNQQPIFMDLSLGNHAALLAIIKQLRWQESHGSSVNCQADEQAGITQLSWQYQADEQACIMQLTWQLSSR